jgi:uncharacterized membrane protein
MKMRRRITWKKFALLSVMSSFGLWASSMVLVIYQELHQQLPACSASSSIFRIDCNAVLSSPYSQIFGIPLEVFAIVYFILNLMLILMVSFGNDWIYPKAMKILFGWRFLGLIIVPYLLTVELLIIKAICLYCTVMHVSIIVDFVIISYLLFYKQGLRGTDESKTKPIITAR